MGQELIVVDANILVFSVLQGEKTSLVHQLQGTDPQWRVPSVWRYEVANILATFVRLRGLPVQDALDIMALAIDTFVPMEEEPDAISALRLATQYRLSAYDAQYIALAEKLDVLCITEDVKLRRVLPSRTRSLAQALN